MRRILINIRGAETASPFTQDFQDFNICPGRAAKLECTGYVARNQIEKTFQRRTVCAKTPGKLKKDRPELPVQSRQRPEEVFGLFLHISQPLQMRDNLWRLEREDKIVRNLFRPGCEDGLYGH